MVGKWEKITAVWRKAAVHNRRTRDQRTAQKPRVSGTFKAQFHKPGPTSLGFHSLPRMCHQLRNRLLRFKPSDSF